MTTRGKLVWVAILYFAEGFPYGFLFDTYTTYFADYGVSLRAIGLVSLVSLPWTLKFLWAPAVDLWGERHHWFVACQLLVGLGLLGTLALPPGQVTPALWALLFALAFAAATQDIAIDAYTIELVDPKEMGPANGVRQTAYRVAIVTTGGLLVWLAGGAGWPAAFVTGAAILGVSALASSRVPRVARPQAAREVRRPLGERVEEAVVAPFRLFLTRNGVASFLGVLAFVLLFRVGEYALGPMVRPFWLQARKFTLEELGFVVGVLGPIWTVLGALLAGWLTTRWGIFRALWVLGLFQGASNLGYAVVAQLPLEMRWPMYVASGIESFCSGLGTTPLMAFLMVICNKGHAATQFALLTALFNITGLIARTSSGYMAESLGFAAYFAATFVISFSAYPFLPWVRRWIPREPAAEGKAEAIA